MLKVVLGADGLAVDSGVNMKVKIIFILLTLLGFNANATNLLVQYPFDRGVASYVLQLNSISVCTDYVNDQLLHLDHKGVGWTEYTCISLNGLTHYHKLVKCDFKGFGSTVECNVTD